MFDVDLAFPLSLGLVAAFNPCGFAMLPAYTSYFLGLESDDETNVARNVIRALVVGLTMTLGFVAVFGLVGILTSTLISESTLAENAPYLTLGFGVLMVPLGIAMVRGFEPKLNIRRLQAGGKTAELPSIFLFGVSYAIASISCTIGLFLTVVVGSFDDGIVGGTAKLIAYAAGMGLVIMALTLSLALARTSVATNMRRFLPYVNRVSGVLMTLAGVYLAIYAWWEIQVLSADGPDDEPWGWVEYVADTGESVRDRVNTWISNVGEGRLAMAITVLLVGALVWVLSKAMKRRSDATWLRVAFVASWLAIELGAYQADLLILPLLRTLADVPERVGNWFTDPFRWPVFFEIQAAVIVGAALYFWGRKQFRRSGPAPADEPSTPSEAASV